MTRYNRIHSKIEDISTLSAPAPQALPATLTDEMRAVLTNENCVYGSADELYAALLAAAPQTKEPTNDR